ncbi:PREDICTED: interleukin-5 receptor subunit alpha isoform X2 [Lepidothrix coronata]|uniref:Interleukin-5 receptor subunit alpha isoform X2 n=1 Tax=Lepidothrix coronata TaxID=321398 RepID=A0A6J0I9C4_9PASS|nr:PREDICTED: interleukin-5 receptor subunit alpha isoform X2 [Lepidothrix coronata]
MKASRMQVCLILLWTTHSVQPNTPQAARVQVFPPVNFTLTVSALAQVLLHWEPNPAQDQKNDTIRYEVKILSPVPEEYDTRKTHSVRTVALHDGFSAHVRTLLLHNDLQMRSEWVQENLPPLPGAPETSITNLSCVTHLTISGTVSLHCSWLPGPGAPQDTEYFLFYRYKNHTEECHRYAKDKWDRNSGCSFPGTHIDPQEADDLVIHINGSSKSAAIKTFQQLFNPNAIEKVNVPRNITVSLEENHLLATWEKPISLFHEECFEYEFYLFNLKSGNKQILKLSSNKFRLRIDVTSRYSIQIRANHHTWCMRGLWSDWSEVIYVGQNKLENSVAWILAVLCVSTSCTFLLVALICKINRVWSKLFPPIPTPSNKFPDPFPVDYERARTCTSDTETEFSSLAEDLYCRALDDSVF